MSVILVMIPAALVLAGLGVAAFIIAARTGQFDDLDTPPLRAVFDDEDDVARADDREGDGPKRKNAGGDPAS